jgi:hypothetical protein
MTQEEQAWNQTMGGMNPPMGYNPYGAAMMGGAAPGMMGIPGMMGAAAQPGGGRPMQPGVFGYGPQQGQQSAQGQDPFVAQLQAQQMAMAQRRMEQQMEDERVDRQFQNMYRIFMLKFMNEGMDQRKQEQSPFPSNIPTELEITHDAEGKEVRRYRAIGMAAGAQNNGPSMEAMMNFMSSQFNNTLQILANSSNKDSPYKDIALKLMDSKQSDPLEFLGKVRSAIPEVFNGGGRPQVGMEQFKMEMDAKMALWDRQMDMERWQAERADKREEKLFQQQSMKEYVNGLRDVGTDILKPVVTAAAEGIKSRMAGPQQAGAAGGRPPTMGMMGGVASATAPAAGGIPSPDINGSGGGVPPMPDLRSMTDEQFNAVLAEKDMALSTVARNSQEIQRRALLVDQENARRQAMRQAQNLQVKTTMDMASAAPSSSSSSTIQPNVPPVTTRFAVGENEVPQTVQTAATTTTTNAAHRNAGNPTT